MSTENRSLQQAPEPLECGHVDLVMGCPRCWEEVRVSAPNLLRQGEMDGGREILWFLMGVVSEMHRKAEAAGDSLDLTTVKIANSLKHTLDSIMKLMSLLLSDPRELNGALEEGKITIGELIRVAKARKAAEKANPGEAPVKSSIVLTDV